MGLVKKYPIIKHILLMIGILILLFFGTFIVLKKYTHHGKEFTLPDLLSENIEDVREREDMNRFEVILIDSVYVNNKPGGIVLAMDPPAGSKVKSGRKIYITITSFDPEDVEMPNLIDLTVRQAVSLLESHGLYCGELIFKPDIGKNAILDQLYQDESIRPNTKLPRHSSINLIVGSGLDTVNMPLTAVPLIIGKTPKEARRALNIASLNIGKEHFGKGVNEENARVKKQSPNYAGRPAVKLGTRVEIWYGDEDKENFKKLIEENTSGITDSLIVDTTNVIDVINESEEEYNW